MREREDKREGILRSYLENRCIVDTGDIPLKAIWLRASLRGFLGFPDTSLHIMLRAYITIHGTRLADAKILLCANFSNSNAETIVTNIYDV